MYMAEGKKFTYEELKTHTMAVAAADSNGTGDEQFDFDEYLAESLLVGTIQEV